MTQDVATKAGYIKIIDYHRTKNALVNNMAIIDHATAEIKASKKVFDYRSILLANFAFTIRIILYHIILVSLAHHAGIGVILLLLVELGYIVLITRNFLKLKYLISIHLFVSKFTQSLFLLIFHMISFIIYLKYGLNSIV